MSQSDPKSVAVEFFARFSASDIAGALAMMTDDATWWDLGRSKVILHTTRAMETAWAMYERLGFRRLPEIDFKQGTLDVFGFGLDLAGPDKQEESEHR